MPAAMLQTQRFEMKYLIDEHQARGISDFLFPYLVLDEYGSQQPDNAYPVHSLYLDSPNLALHQSTINGDRNRYKLRIRFYEREDEAPVYFEIKRRENNAIYKQRCPVKRGSVEGILAGRVPQRSDLTSSEPEDERALYNFCQHVSELSAIPIAHVSYRREAWHGSGNNRIRVTFDRQVCTRAENSARINPDVKPGYAVFGDAVVLELKFTGRFPQWMSEMARVFEIEQCSAAKYVDGILGMEARRLIRPNLFAPEIGLASDKRLFDQLRKARHAFRNRIANSSQ